jgi:hypothetical protein
MLRANGINIVEAGGAQGDNTEIKKTGSKLNRGRAKVNPWSIRAQSKHGQTAPHDFEH